MREPGMKKITAVVAAPDSFEEVETLLRALHRQTVRDQVHVLVVCPSHEKLAVPVDVESIAGEVEILETGEVLFLEDLRTAGVRAATTPYVALFEDHCFPEANWFEIVLSRLEEGWAGVGTVIALGNPATSLAQAVYLLGYGEFGPPIESGPRDFIPGHNQAFRRSVLMELEPGLDDALSMKSVMMRALRARGHRLFLEGGTVAWHFDFHTEPVSIIRFFFDFGRVLGAQRSRSWPVPLRLLAGAGWPALWAVRLWGAFRTFRRTADRSGLGAGCLLHVPGLTLAWALGEWRGLWFGLGPALERLSDWEHDRTRYVDGDEWDRETGRILDGRTA